MRPPRALRTLITVVWAASVTLTMQSWVGGATIYRSQTVPFIDDAHQALLHNRLPPGVTWTSRGMNTTNIRLGVVFLAEGIRRLTGLSVSRIYRALDTVSLFVTILLLLVFLGRLVPTPYALIGAMGFAAVLPLTYQLFVFHPWDRLSVACWVVLLMALERGRFLLFAALLPVVMVIKFDVILLPGLFLLLTLPLDRQRTKLIRSLVATTAMFGITFGVYWALQGLRPGGFEPVPLVPLAIENLHMLRALGLSYPPLLAFGVPLMLSAVGFGQANRFARACALFAAGLLLVYVVNSRPEEFRTEVPVFILLLPAALVGARRLCETVGDVPRPAPSPAT